MQTCYRHPDQFAGVICQRCDRPICPRCMHQASVGFHCPECAKKGRQQVYQGIGSLQTKPVLTQVLIGINVALREGAQNIAFAINAGTVKQVLTKHLSAQRVPRLPAAAP